VGPNRATTGTPAAAAKCVMPESFPDVDRCSGQPAREFIEIGDADGGPRVPLRFRRTKRTGRRASRHARQFRYRSSGQFFRALPENGWMTANPPGVLGQAIRGNGRLAPAAHLAQVEIRPRGHLAAARGWQGGEEFEGEAGHRGAETPDDSAPYQETIESNPAQAVRAARTAVRARNAHQVETRRGNPPYAVGEPDQRHILGWPPRLRCWPRARNCMQAGRKYSRQMAPDG